MKSPKDKAMRTKGIALWGVIRKKKGSAIKNKMQKELLGGVGYNGISPYCAHHLNYCLQEL